MRKIYLVKEYSIVGGKEDKPCGIMYYSSRHKALSDFYNRAKDLEIEILEGKDLLAKRKYSSSYSTFYSLEAFDLY